MLGAFLLAPPASPRSSSLKLLDPRYRRQASRRNARSRTNAGFLRQHRAAGLELPAKTARCSGISKISCHISQEQEFLASEQGSRCELPLFVRDAAKCVGLTLVFAAFTLLRPHGAAVAVPVAPESSEVLQSDELLDNNVAASLREKQKLVAFRDRVLEQAWFNDRLDRWEMSPFAAVYAFDRNLLSQARIRHDGRVVFLSVKGEAEAYAVGIKDLDAYLEKLGGFKGFCENLKNRGIPVTTEVMPVPVEEWTASQFVTYLAVTGWKFVQHIWNLEFVKLAREVYLSVLTGAAEEFMVRFGYPLVQKLPQAGRVLLGFETKGEISEPTQLTLWVKMAQEKLENREPSLPWWLEFPIRAYLVTLPLVMASSWALRIISAILGPRPFPKNNIEKTMRLQEKALKDVMPRLKKVNKDPIKRVFDNMKRIRNPPVRLEDFIGIEAFKEEVDEVVKFLRNPRAFEHIGARAPRGVLIIGDTGMGKTTLARAIASAAKVPVVEVESYDIEGGGDWVGQRAANIRELFKTARQFAPVIILMDDFHNFVGNRGGEFHEDTQEMESLINQFLVELDGFETQQGVVLLATTGYPGKIDPALRRPGRMDRTIRLIPPSRAVREQILRKTAEKTMLSYMIGWVDWALVAEKTEGFTFTELQPIPRRLECAVKHCKVTDLEELFFIQNVIYYFDKIVPAWIRKRLLKKWDDRFVNWLGLRTQKREMETTVQYIDFGRRPIELHDPMYTWTRETKYKPSVWAAGRGLVALLLPNFDTVELLWLDKNSWDGVAFTRFARHAEEGYIMTGTVLRSYFEKQLVVLYGSFVATRLLVPFLKRDDFYKPQLKEAAEIATKMVLQYGWALDDSPVVYMSNSPAMNMGSTQSEVLEGKVTALLDAAYNRAVVMLKRNKHVLEVFVERLVEREYIMKEEMDAILQEQNAVFEKEPFSLTQSANLLPESSTNGRGRVMTINA